MTTIQFRNTVGETLTIGRDGLHVWIGSSLERGVDMSSPRVLGWREEHRYHLSILDVLLALVGVKR